MANTQKVYSKVIEVAGGPEALQIAINLELAKITPDTGTSPTVAVDGQSGRYLVFVFFTGTASA